MRITITIHNLSQSQQNLLFERISIAVRNVMEFFGYNWLIERE